MSVTGLPGIPRVALGKVHRRNYPSPTQRSRQVVTNCDHLQKNERKYQPHSERAIERAILLIRGEKVMLDTDLAVIYGVSTKALNQAVKRNIRSM